MKPRNLLILFVVVLALGAFLWFVERDLPGSEEREEMADRVLPGLEAGEVTALTLEVGGERVRLERRGGGEEEAAGGDDGETQEPGDAEWIFAEPQRYAGSRADAAAVGDLLSALAGLTRERTVEGVEPAEVGLDAPRARVVLELGAVAPVTLLVGGEVPASNNMIVGRPAEGGGVAADAAVVDRGIFTDLDKSAGEWRARDLFPAAREAVERVTLTRDGAEGPVVLVRRDGGFAVVEPVADRADREAVDGLLSALTGLTVERFLDGVEPDAMAGLGLEPPRGTVRVETAGGDAPFVVQVGAPTGTDSVHLRLGDQVVTARTALVEALERPAGEWPSRSLTERRVFEIGALTVEDAAGTLELERATPDWLRDGERIPYAPVSDLLYALTDARAQDTLARENLRLRAPEVNFTLTAETGDDGEEEDGEGAPAPQSETVALHPAGDDGAVPVTVSGRDRVLLLSAAEATAIRDALAAVRAAEPLPEESDDGELPEGVEIEVEEGP